jgi:hypothetical protein
MWSFSINPIVAPWLYWSLVAAGVIAGLAAIAFARWVGALRATAIACLLVALADPSLVREERDPVNDVVVVLIDKSGSQRIANRREQTDQVRRDLERRLAAMKGVEPRFVEVEDVDAGAEGTKLFAALTQALADVPPNRVAGVLMVTDGIVHDIPAQAAALPFAAPVHALITGRPRERDRRIELIETPKFGIVGKDVAIRLRVVDTQTGGPRARIVVRVDGRTRPPIDAEIGAAVRIPLRIEHAGANVVEIDVDTEPGELTDVNNRAVVSIEGVREKLRVLLVSGEPHAGERTWRNLLKSDANVELVHFTILRPPEKQDGTPINELSLIAFPTRELFGEKIKEFDLIIFDRYANQSILPRLYYSNIVKYVREGGAVMIASGPEYASRTSLSTTPLVDIIPARPDGRVIEQPYRARISALGQRHPVTRDLPGGRQDPPAWAEWLRLVSAGVAPNASAVMEGPEGRPVMVLSRADKGRVGIILSDHAWLWARNYREGGPHLDMLRRMAHWLMKEPQLEEEALRGVAKGKTIAVERQTMAETAQPVSLIAPSGATRRVELSKSDAGLFTGVIESDEIGLHRLTDGVLTAFVGVGPENPRELREVLSDVERLKPLVEETGGSIRRVSEDGSSIATPALVMMRSASRYVAGDALGLKANDQAIVRGIATWPVFLGFAGLLLVASLMLSAWLAEGGRFRRAGG